jgi:hypothetical protein
MDGNDAGAIVRGLFAREAAVAVAEPVGLFAAPVKARKKIHRRGSEVAEKTPMTISAAIRAAIADGPKTSAEIGEYVTKRGLEPNSSTVATLLSQMRSKNEITKFDSDLKWRPAVKRG